MSPIHLFEVVEPGPVGLGWALVPHAAVRRAFLATLLVLVLVSTLGGCAGGLDPARVSINLPSEAVSIGF